MLPVTQNDLRPDKGNCLQAAVASLLDLPLSSVPHFVLHKDWEARFVRFMRQRGSPVVYGQPGPHVTGIAVGKTVRGTHHAVVMENGTVTWDPHPSRDGLTAIDFVYALSIPPRED